MNLVLTGLVYAVSTVIPYLSNSIWTERTDNQIQPQDVFFLMNMYQERTLCTRWGQPSTNWTPTIPTDKYSITPGSPTTNYFYIGTNKQFYIDPVLIAEKTPITNLYTSGNFDWYEQKPVTLTHSFIDPFPSFPNTFYDYDYSNRWIVGVYDSFLISGFSNNDFNGLYVNQVETNQFYPVVITTKDHYAFINQNGIELYYSANGTFFEDNRGAGYGDYYESLLPPWLGALVYDDSTWAHYPLYDPFYITCIRGNRLTTPVISMVGTNSVTNNIPVPIDDSPCYKTSIVDDWVLLNRIPSYETLFSQMDAGIFGYPDTTTYSTNVPTTIFSASEDSSPMVWGGWNYPQKDNFHIIIGQDIFWVQNYGCYIDSSFWGVNYTTNWSEWLYHPETWGLTNKYQDTNSGAWIVNFDSNVSVPSNSPNTRLNKNMFQQRYDVLKKMDTLVIKRNGGQYINPNSTPFWESISSNNTYYGYGYGDTPFLAFYAAKTNGYYGTELSPPYMRVTETKYNNVYPDIGTHYQVTFAVHSARLSTYLSSNNVSQVCAYIEANKINADAWTNLFDVASVDGLPNPLLQNAYTSTGESGSGNRYKYSVDINVHPKLPEVLPPVGGTSFCGFQIDDAIMQVKFEMKYQ